MTRAPDYPGFGNACNGCGMCCIVKPCQLARDHCGVFEGPCAALVKEGQRYKCGLVVSPHKFMIGMGEKPWADEVLIPLFSEALGIGVSCDTGIVE